MESQSQYLTTQVFEQKENHSRVIQKKNNSEHNFIWSQVSTFALDSFIIYASLQK